MSEEQARYEGWAILEIFGHQRFAGFVKTEYYGTACMFRLDVPPLEERTRVTKRAGSVDGQWVQAGATVKEGSTPGYSKLFGVGALYALTPCTQEACLKAVEEIQPRPLMLVSLPPEKALAAPGTLEETMRENGFDCCSGNLADGHAPECGETDEDADEDPFEERF